MKVQLQAILDHAQDMILLVQADDLRVVLANRAAQRVLGYHAEQLLGMPITDIECSLQDAFYWEELRCGQFRDIEAQQGEYCCADGSPVAVMKSVHLIQGDSKPLLLVQARDIQH